MEYFIGAGTTLIFLWALWVSYSVYRLLRVSYNHRDAIYDIMDAVSSPSEDDSKTDSKQPMGFQVGANAS